MLLECAVACDELSSTLGAERRSFMDLRWTQQIEISRDRSHDPSRGRITSDLDALRSILRENAIWWVLIRSLYCTLFCE